MKKAIGVRQSGKTIRLILRSAETGIPILVKDVNTGKSLIRKAGEMGVTIPEPISIRQLQKLSEDKSFNLPEIIVDEAEYMLQMILRQYGVNRIDTIAIVTNDPHDELI